jgi:acyl-CoA thioester hydrolase
MDAFQHINNVAYFRYLESTRIAYMEKFGMMQVMRQTNIGPILASAQCQFKVPLYYPDTVISGALVTDVESDRFSIDHRLVSRRLEKIAAQGKSVVVYYDYQKKQKAPIPDEIKRCLIDESP